MTTSSANRSWELPEYGETKGSGSYPTSYFDILDTLFDAIDTDVQALDNELNGVFTSDHKDQYKRVDTNAWEAPQTGVEYYAKSLRLPGQTTYCRLLSVEPPTAGADTTWATVSEACVPLGVEYGFFRLDDTPAAGDQKWFAISPFTSTSLLMQLFCFYDDSAEEYYLQYRVSTGTDALYAMVAYTKGDPLA